MTTYAFCLGINSYRAPIDALKCAERDARDLASFGRHSPQLIAVLQKPVVNL